MQRRELMQRVLSVSALAGFLGPLSLTTAAAQETAPAGSSDNAESLRRELQGLSMRDYSEQGIPTLLTLENLSASPATTPFVPDSFNQAMAEKFERYVDLLLQFKTRPEESDVAALIELMAEAELFPAAAGACL